MAGPFPPRRKGRKRRSARVRNSLRLGTLLVGLTAVNLYVFVWRDGTSVKTLLEPSSTTKSLVDDKEEAIAEPARALTGAGRHTRHTQIDAPGGGRVASLEAGRPAATPLDGPVPAGEGSPRSVEGQIGNSDTLGSVLAREGFGAAAGNVVKALSKVVDPKLIRPGEAYVASFDEEGVPESFEYRPTPAVRYLVDRQEDGTWSSRKEEQPLETKVESAAGAIDSSLYDSIHRAGESAALVSLLVDLFAWDINFYIDTHPGDVWKVVVEKQYLGGKLYKYGRVLAAEYSGRVGTFRAFWWAPSPKAAGRYFDDKGQAVAKTLLKCPLRFVRISSKFDRKRFHPVLHQTKAHLGVDYAAPVGTPVWASAGGKIVECQMKRGSGNTVVINHGAGLATRYYHLSRFAKGLKVGAYVRQKEVIGFVGSTGLSTGPHLHFGLTRNGAFVDPMKMPMAREAPVSDRASFQATIRPHLAALKTLVPVAKAESKPDGDRAGHPVPSAVASSGAAAR